MIKFGPSGNDELFYEEGHKTTLEAPKWVSEKGLSVYEYAFTRGINLKPETAKKIGEAFKEYGIEVTAHAPYYINFGNPTEEAREKSINYVINSLKMLKIMGGKKLCVHPGTQLKQDRETAMKNAFIGVEALVERVYAEGLSDMYVCLETMGKHRQLGTVDEIIELCKIDKILMPTVDFGHVNAYNAGSLKTVEDFREVTDKIRAGLGEFRGKNFHVHFSKIEYTEKGEKVHLTLADTIFGPEFEPLAVVLKEDGLIPTIISESKHIMAQDAVKLKQIYENTEV
jgi:deoxyribonuclease-4